MKSGKRQMTERIELPKQEKIKTLGEKETYKYLEILKWTSPNKWWWKKKSKRNISVERGNYSKPNYTAEISLKE